ncbi:LCP family protein [Paenibacillus sp. GSMTC-2017]|uniref:LCP family protein n=1 Tax=Paenibacillus sp. GSMTC-2017 TaxID=2794350 RepID=UPI0018D76B42|nr:LCP family protein [Paenibacillus sp. GSMTC-2017]MBH5319348.1 LCP family protein [Paenibacillus sp. GSMTC-2017]
MKKKYKRLYIISAALLVIFTAVYFNRNALAMTGFDWFLQDGFEKKLETSYKPAEGRDPKHVGVDLTKEQPFSMLLMGIDQRKNEVGRSDTMIYTVVRPSDGNMLLVSIPRDLYVDIAGRKHKDKINHSYAFGRAAMTMDTVEQLFDAPVNYYATINFEGFRDVIDAMGGIALPIKEDMVNDNYNHEKFVIKGGQSLYNGKDALNFVRYREDAGGDMNRTERHQQFISAMIDKATGMKQWTKIPQMIEIMGENFTTDMRPGKMIDLAQGMLQTKERKMYSHTLDGRGERFDNGLWYYLADEKDLKNVQDMIDNWLDAETPTASLIMPPKYAEEKGKETKSLSVGTSSLENRTE